MTDDETFPSKPFERSFIAALIEDVIAVDAQLRAADDQPNRRSSIRTTFAALEGAVWICREHVRSVARSMGELTPLIDMALRELTYTVSERGEIIEHVRHITLPAMIRLTVKQAQRVAPGLEIDFGDAGWAKLRDATKVRNRITHPKSVGDLLIDAADLATVREGFSWVLSMTERVMGASVAAQMEHNRDLRTLLDALNRGDPIALQMYREAVLKAGDED